jgi:diacylglycerol kinase family enzyme
LPLGTGNSFLRDFTDHGAEDALQAIVEDRHRPCDVVRLEHDQGELFYINLLSLGFVADVCSTANRRFKRFGVASYALAVMLQTARLSPQPIRFRLDGGPWVEQEAIFVSLCNSRFTGGTMMMAPRAQTADGAVDVIVAGRMGRLGLLRAFPKIFAGTHLDLQELSGQTARKVEFDCPGPIALMIDGEVVTREPRLLEVLPAAVEVQV